MPRKTTSPKPRRAGSPVEPLELLRALWAIDHGLAQVSKRMERTLGVTGPQRLAVRLIGQRPGIGPADLADLLHVDRGASTGLVQRLELKGLVQRLRHPGDGRRWSLSLTERGRQVDRLDHGTIEALVRQVLETAAAEEVRAASRLLRQLIGALQEPAGPRAPGVAPLRRAR
ncbi:MAG: MarR family transcriptional regulator [Anaeromyxobacteraceae bacterium]|nr:MarR family transcriptional regulator [Anaeromyxobacteraceae bacterium]